MNTLKYVQALADYEQALLAYAQNRISGLAFRAIEGRFLAIKGALK